MMYQNKMAVAVKAHGRVLREIGESVYLPFGCEYSLLIKNLNSVRALVKVWIDGVDVTEGTSGLIVPPNEDVDLERFIKNGNLHAGNRFKFIERTASVSKHRGNKVDDGLIRIEFEFEQQPKPLHYDPYWADRRLLGSYDSYVKGVGTDSWITNTTTTFSANASDVGGAVTPQNASLRSRGWESTPPEVKTDVGITVPGSVSEQSFTWGAWFPTDGVKHAMVLHMLGEVEGQAVAKPIHVKTKLQCTTCGTSNKHGTKYCRECGTGLQIV